MKKVLLRTCLLVFSGAFFTNAFAELRTIDVLAEGGYSSVKLDDTDYKGYNVGAKLLFAFNNDSSLFDYILGGGYRYEHVKATGSGTTNNVNYSFTETLDSNQIGVDIGLKFRPISELSIYTLGTLYGSIGSTYNSKGTVGGVDYDISPTVTSNSYLGVGIRALYNITNNFGIGAGASAARGVLSYSRTVVNGTQIGGDSGGYNDYNFNVVAAYYF